MPEMAQKDWRNSEIKENLAILGERMSSLEETNSEFEAKIDELDKNDRDRIHKNLNDIRKIKEDVEDIKRAIKTVTSSMHHIINDMRAVPRKEELESVKRRVDRWKPEEFVSRAECRRIIRKKYDF